MRFIGISGTIPNLQEQIEMGVFDAFQIPYSALERDARDADRAGLAGRGRHHHPRRRGEGRPRQGAGRLLGRPGSASASTTCWTACRAWSSSCASPYSHPDLDTTIVGTINPDHLQDNINALLAGPLPADVYAEAKRRLAEAGSRAGRRPGGLMRGSRPFRPAPIGTDRGPAKACKGQQEERERWPRPRR